MRRPRSTSMLIGAFFVALLTLWGLERAGVLTEAERTRRRDRVLPELIDVDPMEVRRIEIVRGDVRLVFDRRGPRRWRLSEPADVDAAPVEVERLIAVLKGLRKSPEAGEVDGPAASYKLDPPEATVRVWKDPSLGPIATLEIGRIAQHERFVRSTPSGGVEVVAARALEAVDRPAVRWRETAPVSAWAFPIAGLRIVRDGLDATVASGARGAWRLTSPVVFPAESSRIGQLAQALASLRVDPEADGFVADHVKDFAPYGLDPPVATIELRPAVTGAEALTLMVGSSPKDRPDDVYIRVGGRNNVMIVDGRFRRELPETLKDLRSRRIAEIHPPAVDRIEIDAPGGPFRLERGPQGWNLSSPAAVTADATQVSAFLKAVEELHTIDFFDPGYIAEPGVEVPSGRIRIWESPKPGEGSSADAPAFSLAIGRHDALRKVVFARSEGDASILALPDTFLSTLPTSRFAFRDTALPSVQPTSITRLTIIRPGRTTVLEPGGPSGSPESWKMVKPVAADADLGAVTSVVMRLSELRASSFVADAQGDLSRFGLEKPILEVTWEATSSQESGTTTRSLRVGSPLPGDPSKHFAVLTDFPAVFAIEPESLAAFGAEFHDARVLTFRTTDVRRLTLRSETRTLAYRRRPRPRGGPVDWAPEPGTPIEGVDLSRFDNLVRALSELRTVRFIQYEGPFPPGAGLASPRLTIAVELEGGGDPVILRIGSKFLDEWVCGATGDGPSGPAFLLQGPAWEGLIQGVEGGLPPIPDVPFAPPEPS